MDLNKARALQYVRRLNFERCNRYQSVAEHSFYVGILAFEMAGIVGYDNPEYCMRMAMLHDITEAVTGDIPFLTKRAIGLAGVSILEDKAEREIGVSLGSPLEVVKIVNYCDALEFALYLKEERESGNQTLVDIEHETWGRLVVMIVGGIPAPEFEWAAGLLGVTVAEMALNEKDFPSGIKH